MTAASLLFGTLAALVALGSASQSVCRGPAPTGKGEVYNTLVKGLCFKNPKAAAGSNQCLGATLELTNGLLCSLGSGMCGIDKANNKPTGAVGKLLPAILKVIPFMDSVDPNGFVCAQVQQACCRAGAALVMAEALVNYTFGDVKIMLANIDHVTDEAILVVKQKAQELILDNKVAKAVGSALSDLVKLYDNIVDSVKVATDNAVKAVKGTEACKMVTKLSKVVDKAVTADVPKNICKNLEAQAKGPKAKDPSFVSSVKAICGSKPETATIPGQCGGTTFDVSGSIICALGARICDVPNQNKVSSFTGRLMPIFLKLVPILNKAVDNEITCAVVENACCRTAGNFEAANNAINNALNGKVLLLDALEDLTDSVIRAIKEVTDDIVASCGRVIDSVVDIGKGVGEAFQKVFSMFSKRDGDEIEVEENLIGKANEGHRHHHFKHRHHHRHPDHANSTAAGI